jgi:anti-sigma factor RsiW
MDHEVVVRQKMTERYLLNELDSESRDEFEEHFFDCPECAVDVRAGSAFVEQTRNVLARERPETAPVSIAAPVPVDRGWFAWLRPAFAAPALALLLVVVGYQNLVTYPRLQQALSRPQVLPWAPVNVGTWGSGGPVITVSPGQGFLLFVRIPPDGSYSHYQADLYGPAGKVEWSLTIPVAAGQDQWPVQVPGSNREAGTYTVAVRGVTASGESKEAGRTSFQLKIQN